jgi:type II restriction enzyme
LGHSNLLKGIFLVPPDSREADVRAKMARPGFAAVVDLDVRYLAYGELKRHREPIIRFGEGLKAIRSASKALPCASADD